MENKQNVILYGIMTVIIGFGMLTIGSYIYFAIAGSITPTGSLGAVSSNTFTFTGNTSEGQYINITTGIAPYGKSCFYFNTTGVGKPIGCLVVDVRNGANTSNNSNNAFQTSIALDTDLAPLVTVTTANNTTILTSINVGTTYNWAVNETLTNGAWTSSTFIGGVNAWAGQANQNSFNRYVLVVFPIFGLALMILGFSVILFVLRGLKTEDIVR